MVQIAEYAERLEVEHWDNYTANIRDTKYHLPTTFVINETARRGLAEGLTLFIEGLGEGTKAAKHTMAVFDYMGIPAANVQIPFDGLPADKLSLTTVSRELPNQFAEEIIREHGISIGDRMAVVGDSQGAAVAYMAAHENPGLYDMAIGISPLGLNRGDYLPTGGEPTSEELTNAAKSLLGRLMLRNSFRGSQWPIHLINPNAPPVDPGVIRGTLEVMSNMRKSHKAGGFMDKVKVGVDLDLIPDVVELVDRHHVDVRAYAGIYDPLFPGVNVGRNLGAVGLADKVFRPTATSHNLMMSAAGTEQLKFVSVDALGSTNPDYRDLSVIA